MRTPIDEQDISVIKNRKTWPGSPNTRTRTHGETHIHGIHKRGRAAEGIHKRGWATEGRPPPFVEAAGGRPPPFVEAAGGRPLYMGLAMGTGPCIWAAWAGFPYFYHANVSFVYGCPHGYAPKPIKLPLGTISPTEPPQESYISYLAPSDPPHLVEPFSPPL